MSKIRTHISCITREMIKKYKMASKSVDPANYNKNS